MMATILAFIACESIIIDTTVPNPEEPGQEQPKDSDDEPNEKQDPSTEEPDNGEGNEDDEPETPENPEEEEPETPDTPDTPDMPDTPEVDTSITAWNGLWANDSHKDSVGSDNDFFHELNTFTNRVTVTFSGNSATVESSNNAIASYIDGGYVALDMTSVSGVEVIVSGVATNGGLKIYGDSKYKLVLNGADITSQRGPAINLQANKRVYLHLADGSTNRLTDCATYSDDHYTAAGSYNEDRKGALFAEGHIIVSGYGALVVAGKYKHAIATDGYYYQRPGSTIAITEAAKNGLQVKGDSDDGIGAYIRGGAISANVASTAGKCIKCDLDVVVEGGVLDLTTSGNATYDSTEGDTSSAAGIKSGTITHIKGGVITTSSSGTGGKGISTDTDLIVDGGDINITTTGGQYKYSSQQTSSPKGIRADGNITVNGGYINISVTGRSEGSEGLESKAILTFNGGETIVNAYDDGINAANGIVINGGKIYTRSTNNDGMDTNNTLNIYGGLLIGIGSGNPEGGVDADNSNLFKIYGGTAIGIGGTMMGKPSTASTQYSVVYSGFSATTDQRVALLDASNKPIITFDIPITMSSSTLFFSSPEIKNGTTYTISSNGTISDYSEMWQGWYNGGSWSSGTTLTTFTPTSVTTSIGNSGGGGPGGGGGGGNRPWW